MSSAIKNMTIMTTTNRCEGANKSITKLLAKNIFHRDVTLIIAFVILTLLNLNFVKIVLLYVVLELGIPEIYFSRFDSKMSNTKNMQQQRYCNTRPDTKAYNKCRKKAKKLDNQPRTKRFKATRRPKKMIQRYELNCNICQDL